MDSPKTPKQRSVDTTAPARAGTASTPKLPHEQDESVGSTGGIPSPRVQQGNRDLKRGLVDTSRAPEADAAYRKLKK